MRDSTPTDSAPTIKSSTLWVSNFYEEFNCERKLSPRAIISILLNQGFSTAQPIRWERKSKAEKIS